MTPSKTSIDWLSVSTLADPAELVSATRSLFPGVKFNPTRGGWKGYTERFDMEVPGGTLGFLATGGESQRGRSSLSLTGLACSMLDDHNRLADVYEPLKDARPTRLDVALDDYRSERVSIERVLQAYEANLLRQAGRGRPPKLDSHGEAKKRGGTPWGGITLTVGSRESDCYTRFYEKGCKKLEEMENAHHAALRASWQQIWNQWPPGHPDRAPLYLHTRAEVELKPKTRALTLDMIRSRDNVFAAVSPFHSSLVEHAEPMRRDRLDRVVIDDAERKLDNLAKQYSRTINELVAVFGGDASYVWNRLRGCIESPVSERIARVDGLKRTA